MKIAIVHEYLNQVGGAELVLKYMHEVFPDAPIYTLIYEKDQLPEEYHSWDIRPVGWSKYFPFRKSMYRNYLPLYPVMIEQMDLREYDLVLSSSYLWAKGVLTPSRTLHICYCHTPMRQAWELYFQYKHSYSTAIRKFVYPFMFNYLRMWDRLASDRVDRYIANSANVSRRIAKYYRRSAEIIYPPVETDRYTISEKTDDFYLCLSRLVPYKKTDIAIEAFNQLDRKLIVVGTGNQEKKLKKRAGKNIEFTGFISETEKIDLLSKARALVFPPDEDFGIVPVEAQLSGRPVIAYGHGGILETTVPNKTSILFKEQTPAALIDAVKEFESRENSFDPNVIRSYALKFDKTVFMQKFREYVLSEYTLWKENLLNLDTIPNKAIF